MDHMLVRDNDHWKDTADVDLPEFALTNCPFGLILQLAASPYCTFPRATAQCREVQPISFLNIN